MYIFFGSLFIYDASLDSHRYDSLIALIEGSCFYSDSLYPRFAEPVKKRE